MKSDWRVPIDIALALILAAYCLLWLSELAVKFISAVGRRLHDYAHCVRVAYRLDRSFGWHPIRAFCRALCPYGPRLEYPPRVRRELQRARAARERFGEFLESMAEPCASNRN